MVEVSDIYTLAEEVLRMTKTLTLTGQPDLAEQEIEAFALLMEKREPMVEQLTGLINETRLNKNVSDNTKKLINDIIEADKENIRIMEHIKKSVQSSLKEIKSGRRLSNAYAHPLDEVAGGSFDAKQ